MVKKSVLKKAKQDAEAKYTIEITLQFSDVKGSKFKKLKKMLTKKYQVV